MSLYQLAYTDRMSFNQVRQHLGNANKYWMKYYDFETIKNF